MKLILFVALVTFAFGCSKKNPSTPRVTTKEFTLFDLLKTGESKDFAIEDYNIEIGYEGAEDIFVRILSGNRLSGEAAYVVKQGDTIIAGYTSQDKSTPGARHEYISDPKVIELILRFEPLFPSHIEARFADFLRYLELNYYYDTYRCRGSKYQEAIKQVWESDRGPVAFRISDFRKHYGIQRVFYLNINENAQLVGVTIKHFSDTVINPNYVNISDMTHVIVGQKSQMLVDFRRFGMQCGDAYRFFYPNIDSPDTRLPPYNSEVDPKASDLVDRALDRRFPNGDYIERELQDEQWTAAPIVFDNYFKKLPTIYFEVN